MLLATQRKLNPAETHARRAVELLEGLANDFPGIPDYRRELATALTSLAAIRLQAQPPRPDEARQNLERARDLLETLVADHPEVPDYRSLLANALISLGDLTNPADPKKADAIYQRAIEVEKAVVERYPQVFEYVSHLGRIHESYGRLLDNRGQADEARSQLREAVADYRKALAIYPNDPLVRNYLVNALGTLGLKQLQAGDHDAGAQIADELAEALKTDPQAHLLAGAILAQAILVARGQKDLDDAARQKLAADYARRAMAQLHEAARQGFRGIETLDNPDFQPLRELDPDGFAAFRDSLIEQAQADGAGAAKGPNTTGQATR